MSLTGAGPDDVLCGSGPNNSGLRVRIAQAQPPGHEGPIRGPFVILDAGDGRHAELLAPLVQQETDAQQVLALLRRHRPGCVNVVNAKILVQEAALAPRLSGAAAAPDRA